jgi:hypothetical protein
MGTIAAPQNAGSAGLAGVAVNGSTLFASEPATVGDNVGQGAVYVFAKSPAGGWPQAGQVATLTTSDGQQDALLGDTLGPTAVSGSTVAASSLRTTPTGHVNEVDVFVEPSGGWSGTVHETAELSPSAGTGCRNLGSPSALGDDVFVTCVQDLQSLTGLAPSGSVLAFIRPPGGWPATPTESATLLAPLGRSLGASIAPVRNAADVFAASVPSSFDYGVRTAEPTAPSAVYGFHRPAAGWSGQVRPSTELQLPANASIAGLASSGRDVFVATLTANKVDGAVVPGAPVVYAFTKPRHGWSGRIAASARLVATVSASLPVVSLAARAGKVVLSVTDESGVGNQCPCGESLATFTQPARGWHGTVTPTGTGGEGALTDGAAASDGTTTFVIDGTNVDLFPVPDRPSPASLLAPTTTGTLTGARSGHPSLRLRITTQPYPSTPAAVTVTLPEGLRLTGGRAATVDGRDVRAVGVTRSRLTLAVPAFRAVNTVVVGPGVLRLSPTLRAAVRRAGRAHRLQLRLRITVVTQAGDRTTRTVIA